VVDAQAQGKLQGMELKSEEAEHHSGYAGQDPSKSERISRAEIALLATCFNIRRMITIFGGVIQLIGSLWGWIWLRYQISRRSLRFRLLYCQRAERNPLRRGKEKSPGYPGFGAVRPL